MTVYELIQELTNFEPSTDVEFHAEVDIEVNVEGETKQTIEATFDGRLDFEDITDKEVYLNKIIINLEY